MYTVYNPHHCKKSSFLCQEEVPIEISLNYKYIKCNNIVPFRCMDFLNPLGLLDLSCLTGVHKCHQRPSGCQPSQERALLPRQKGIQLRRRLRVVSRVWNMLPVPQLGHERAVERIRPAPGAHLPGGAEPVQDWVPAVWGWGSVLRSGPVPVGRCRWWACHKCSSKDAIRCVESWLVVADRWTMLFRCSCISFFASFLVSCLFGFRHQVSWHWREQ